MEEFVRMADGALLWTTTSGSGPALVMLNGGPGMADYLAPVATVLEAHCTVHRYEQRGCGRSEGGPLTLAQYIDDLEALRQRWGYDHWIVVGHSWGVDLALAYAIAHRERVAALIGLSGGRVHNDRSWHATYSALRHKEELPRAAGPYSVEVNRALSEDWKAFCRRPGLLADLARLEVSALFLFGKNDIRPSWPTEQIAALLPRGTFQRLPGADHHLWVGNPEGMKSALSAWLRDI